MPKRKSPSKTTTRVSKSTSTQRVVKQPVNRKAPAKTIARVRKTTGAKRIVVATPQKKVYKDA